VPSSPAARSSFSRTRTQSFASHRARRTRPPRSKPLRTLRTSTPRSGSPGTRHRPATRAKRGSWERTGSWSCLDRRPPPLSREKWPRSSEARSSSPEVEQDVPDGRPVRLLPCDRPNRKQNRRAPRHCDRSAAAAVIVVIALIAFIMSLVSRSGFDNVNELRSAMADAGFPCEPEGPISDRGEWSGQFCVIGDGEE
jgi:hypothetical protein